MPDQNPVELRVASGIATATLNNPPMNVATLPLMRRLAEIVQQVESDPSVRALIITGKGDRAFNAGSDINEIPDMLAAGDIIDRKIEFEDATFSALDNMQTPTIAAVNGLALGGGLELALCCDFIIADETAQFGQPEIKLGLFPGAGGAIRLPRRIGEGRAKQLILLGDLIDASTAHQWGLVDRLSPEGQVHSTAITLAERLLANPARALAFAKQAIALRRDMGDREALLESVKLFGEVCTTADATEGVRAFIDKRSPRFSHL